MASLLIGCGGGGNDPMPLKIGNAWKYSIVAGFRESIAEVKVVRHTSVAGQPGFAVSGPSGQSFLAWKGDVLISDRLGNARFAPAIPLLVNANERVRRKWSGTVSGAFGRLQGEGAMNQAPFSESFGGRKVIGLKSDLVVSLSNGTSMRLVTYFEPGHGIVKQRYFYGGNNLVTLEKIGGG
jgi:hypothetical protein